MNGEHGCLSNWRKVIDNLPRRCCCLYDLRRWRWNCGWRLWRFTRRHKREWKMVVNSRKGKRTKASLRVDKFKKISCHPSKANLLHHQEKYLQYNRIEDSVSPRGFFAAVMKKVIKIKWCQKLKNCHASCQGGPSQGRPTDTFINSKVRMLDVVNC